MRRLDHARRALRAQLLHQRVGDLRRQPFLHLRPSREPFDEPGELAQADDLAVGEDPDREGLLKTPNRVARAYVELMAGMRTEPRAHLKTVFNERYDEVVLLRDIQFHSLCEHHLLPFTGRAHVAYLPDGKVVGLSKLARLVEGFARRPQVQERLTTQIADALMEELSPAGAACVIEASHTCMTIRGANKPGSTMVTSALRGIFKDNPASRAEVLSLIHGSDGLRP